MTVSADYLTGNLHRVEVSGWDQDQAFFVERSELEWNESSGKRVLLRQNLAQRTARVLRQVLLHLPEWGSQSQEIGRQFP